MRTTEFIRGQIDSNKERVFLAGIAAAVIVGAITAETTHEVEDYYATGTEPIISANPLTWSTVPLARGVIKDAHIVGTALDSAQVHLPGTGPLHIFK